MSDPFVGEIRIFGFNFAPYGWAFCNGQILSIAQNTALFSLLGTTYGGNGQTTYALPDLQGCAPLHKGQGQGLTANVMGQEGGALSVTLTNSQIPIHSHSVQSSNASGNTNNPTGNIWAMAHAGKTPIKMYSNSTGSPLPLSTQAFGQSGGGLPHNNMPPYLVANFCIALQGVYPPRP